MKQLQTESFSVWKRKIANRKPTREIKNRLLSVNDLMEKLGVSRMTIYRWRKSGRFPEGRRLAGSNLVKWSEATIDQWVKEEGL